MAYPTLAELSSFMTDQGFTLGSFGSAVLSAAIEDFEKRTGFDPFLAESSSTEYTFDPPFEDPDFRLDFGGGFSVIDTVEVDGETFTVGNDGDCIELKLHNTATIGLRFLTFPGRLLQSVAVTGRRGYSSTIPDDVFLAIVQRASALAIPTAVKGVGVPSEIRQGSITVKIDAGSSGSKIDQWNSYFASVCRRYRT